MLTLKIILLIILTFLPFLHHYYILPRSKKDEKYKNLRSLLGTLNPKLKRLFSKFHEKIKKDESTRKFFSIIIFFVMVNFLFVDWFSSLDAAEIYHTLDKKNNLSLLAVNGQYEAAVGGLKTLNNYLYPYLTFPIVRLLSVILIVPFYSYKITDKILSKLHNNIHLFMMNGVYIYCFAFFWEGRMIIIYELIFIINLAAMVYPNREERKFEMSNNIINFKE